MSAATAQPVARQPLSAKQRDVLLYIVAYFGDHMTPPAIRDIGDRFGIRSPNGVLCHLKALHKKGYIALTEEGHARSIRVPGLADAVRAVADQFTAEIESESQPAE